MSVAYHRSDDGILLHSRGGIEVRLIDCPVARRGFRSFFGVWLVRDATRGTTFLVDCGPAAAAERIAEAVWRHAGGRLDALLLTHVHMDHCGSAGALAREFPDLRVIAPAKGARHLVDPTRLVTSSRAVLGDIVDAYGEITSVPETALSSPDALGGLRAIDAPGHAPYHNAYVYRAGDETILFPGEAAGVHLDPRAGGNFGTSCRMSVMPYIRPATPPRFVFPVALASLDRVRETRPTIVCYAHFGASDDASLLDGARDQMLLWRDVCAELLSDDPTAADDPIGRLLPSLLDADPNLGAYRLLEPDIRDREDFFIANSLRGIVGWIQEERSSERKG
jgi:glyoxylase-like metal-dependent hydrolase (beta-lactamase superfamily II)